MIDIYPTNEGERMKNVFPYLLFMKMYRVDLQIYIGIYIENHIKDEATKRSIHILTSSILKFITEQFASANTELIELKRWMQVHVHVQLLTHENEKQFLAALNYAITEQLKKSEASHFQNVLETHEILMRDLSKQIKYHFSTNAKVELPYDYLQRLHLFSRYLIELNGTEDLATIAVHAEEIFQFKRVMLFRYNPWLEEFAGIIGSEMHKLERMKGKVEIEPVFSSKQPIYLADPSPFVQTIAIELFELSSIIFIPIKQGQQLFGWLSFDQIGDFFDCSPELLSTLEQVGQLLALYLNRKQYRSTFHYPISISEKERIILNLIIEGYSNKEIASFIYLSEYTIRDYIKELMRKFNAKNRTQLISTAFRMGVIQ